MKLSELKHLNLLMISCTLAGTKGISRQTETPVSKETILETCKKYLSRHNMSLTTRDFFPHTVTYISYAEEESAPSRLHSEAEVFGVSVACHPNGLHRRIMSSLDSCNVSDGYQSQALSRTVFSAYLPICLTLCLAICVFILLFYLWPEESMSSSFKFQ